MKEALVTVVTTTSPRGEYLEESIQSVLRQNYSNFEIVVVDDSKGASSQGLLERYADRLQMIDQCPGDEHLQLKKLLALAQGEMLCLMRPDEPLLAGALRAGVDALRSNPEVLVAYPDWLVIDDDGLIRGEQRNAEFSLADMILEQSCIPGPASVFRRTVLGDEPWILSSILAGGDHRLWLSAARRGAFIRIPHLYGCLRGPGGSSIHREGGLEAAKEQIDLMEEFFSSPVPPEIAAIRRDAFATAYYQAGSLLEPRLLGRINFFLKFLRSASPEMLRKQPGRLLDMALLLCERWTPAKQVAWYLRRRRQRSHRIGNHYSLIASDFT